MQTEWARVSPEATTKPPNLSRQLGAVIRRHRSRLQMSQNQLAETSGLHRAYISGLERGARNPTVCSVQKVARALKIPVAKLFENAELSV